MDDFTAVGAWTVGRVISKIKRGVNTIRKICIGCKRRFRINKMYHDIQNSSDIWTCEDCFQVNLEELKCREELK